MEEIKMKNAWLVRPYPHGISRIAEFRKEEIIAVGWPGIGDLTGKTREQIKQTLENPPYKLSGLKLGNAYATIDLFVNRMHPGEIVLVPDGQDIFFAEICSDYFMNPKVDNQQDGYPHQRKVQWLHNVARYELSKELRTSLKVHRTVADLSRHYEEITALAHGMDYQAETASVETISVSYPLRKNFVINFDIPADMTKDEAKRLAQHLETLYYTE